MRTIGWCLMCVVIISLLPRPLSAQATDNMDRPTWKVGDRWVQAIARDPGGWKGREVSTVLRIADFDGVPAYHIQFTIEWTDSGGNKRIEQFVKIRDGNLTPIAYADQQGRVFRRLRADWLRWPLVVGASWHVDGAEEVMTRTGWVKFRVSQDVSVKRMEEVKVPAGTFMTVLVTTLHRRFDESGQLVEQGLEDDWISPQARIWVKYSYKGIAGSEAGELLEHRPAP